jgi:hypothetical protein
MEQKDMSAFEVISSRLDRLAGKRAAPVSTGARESLNQSSGSSVLDGILKGIKPPRDGSHRNDFRR